jgi:hypothetical protein
VHAHSEFQNGNGGDDDEDNNNSNNLLANIYIYVASYHFKFNAFNCGFEIPYSLSEKNT